MRDTTFTITWNDEASSRCSDVLPGRWFESLGTKRGMTHRVLDRDGSPIGIAKCDLVVTTDSVELDYLRHAKFNEKREMLPGVLRLLLDRRRAEITRALWKDPGAVDFAPADATIEAVVSVALESDHEPKGIPEGITREHVLSAFDDFDNGVSHRFYPSTDYDVLHGTRRYPPKAIIGLAAKRLNGIELGPDDFSGGEKSKCFRVLRSLKFEVVKKPGMQVFPDEIQGSEQHHEGSVTTVLVNRYERDPDARAKCVMHFGTTCQVCAFDFGHQFGAIGQGFIHVHHLQPLASIQRDYVVDPKRDLRPVCPNCHAMLHRRTPPFTIEELKALRK